MNCVRARRLRRLDDELTAQVRLGRSVARPSHRLVRVPDEWGIRIGIAVDRHRADAHFARGSEDTAGDLAPVRDQNSTDGLHDYIRKTPKPRRPLTSLL